MTYLTPDRFRNMGLGSDLSGLQDAELASVLDRASAMVDSYCTVPNLPQRHSFLGGTITDESHTWRQDQVRVFPRHTPIKTCEQFRIYATNGVYLNIDPADIFVEPSGSYMEVVALSVSPVGFWAASSLMSLTSPVSKINYTYGYSFDASERLYLTDAGEYRAQNQFWDDTVTPEIYLNGTATTSGFAIDYVEGTVTFTPQLAATDTVSANYTYVLPSAIAQATGVVAASVLADRDLIAKGMGNLAEIAVEEVRLRRDSRRTGTVVSADTIPEAAKALLAPYRFISVR